MNTDAEVYLWGSRIALIHLGQSSPYVTFEYDRDFLGSGIEVSPIHMPLSCEYIPFSRPASGCLSRSSRTACGFPAGPVRKRCYRQLAYFTGANP